MTEELTVADLDPASAPLARVLNEAPGLHVAWPGATSPDGRWSITVHLDVEDEPEGSRPTVEAWHSFEFLVWLIGHDLARAGRKVTLRLDALPPWLNYPGRMVTVNIEGDLHGPGGISPTSLAQTFEDLAGRYHNDPSGEPR